MQNWNFIHYLFLLNSVNGMQGDRKVAKVADFGLAKIKKSISNSSEGNMAGTAGFKSPER